jgi:hypothetical protein
LSDGSDFLINGGQSFTFGPEARVHSFSIAIIDDDIFETDEFLYVSLSTSTTKFVAFDEVTLRIDDNDSKTVIKFRVVSLYQLLYLYYPCNRRHHWV